MHLPVVAIDDDRVAVFGKCHEPHSLPHDRNAHGARDDHHVAGHRAVFQHEAAQVLSRIIQQFRRAHGAGKHDGIGWQLVHAATRIPGQLAQKPVGEIVEIMHPLAQIRIRHAHHPRLGIALHLFDSRFGREPVMDRLFHAANPALVVGEHPVALQHLAMLAFLRHIAARQHVVDRDPERAQRFGQPDDFLVRILVQKIGHNDPMLVQHHMPEPDPLVIAITLYRHRTGEIEFQSRRSNLLEVARGDHLGDHHSGGFERLDLVFAIVAAGLVLHDQNPERAPGSQDRHAEEGMVDFFARLRQVAEGGMRLRIGKVQRLGGSGDRADKTLAHLQLRKVNGLLVEAFRRVEFQNAVRAQHIGRAHLGHHVAGDLGDDPVEAFLRIQRFGHQFAQTLQQHARTRRQVSHRHNAPLTAHTSPARRRRTEWSIMPE